MNWCRIYTNRYVLNGENHGREADLPLNEYLALLYRELMPDYPKFHKMDPLAKLAVLGTELLLKSDISLNNQPDDKTALLFANSTSSEYSDREFQRSVDNGPASPSHFVYTLPNIMLGEVSIKNHWFGESLYLFQAEPDFQEIAENISLLINKGSETCLFAWIDVASATPDAFFCVVNKTDSNHNLAAELQSLYTHTL